MQSFAGPLRHFEARPRGQVVYDGDVKDFALVLETVFLCQNLKKLLVCQHVDLVFKLGEADRLPVVKESALRDVVVASTVAGGRRNELGIRSIGRTNTDELFAGILSARSLRCS